MLRKPQAKGQFYPAQAAELRKQLEQLIDNNAPKQAVLGMILPHAGYIYSGGVAGSCFSRANLTESVIILGPNHTGEGQAFSIFANGAWQTPIGNTEVDSGLAKDIIRKSALLQEDYKAHAHEHSIEVQLPFLQYLLPSVKIVPIVIAPADWQLYNEIGRAIAAALKQRASGSLIIASSDFSHYLPQEKASAQDKLAIEAILRLDEKELLRRIEKFKISMCGYAPVACMLCALKQLGAKKAKLLKYQTSGDVSGDYSSVVGYAAIIIS